MSSQFISLLTKEWMERRRWFWCATGILLYLLGYGIAYEFEYRTRAFIASFYSTSLMFIMFGSILISMTIATGEYSQKTLKFTSSLPVSLFKVGWARLLTAWGCLVIPIVIAAIVTTLVLESGLIQQAEFRPTDYLSNPTRISLPKRPSIPKSEAVAFLWTLTAIATCTAIWFTTWISLLGTWCRKEGTVGFLGVILVVLTFLYSPSSGFRDDPGFNWLGCLIPESLAIPWGYGEKDGSSYTDLELAPHLAVPLIANLGLSLFLGVLFARNYGWRSEAGPVAAPRWYWPRLPRLLSRVPVRWPGRLAALTWLDARQSVPLCLSGLALAAIITFFSLRTSHTFPTIESQFAKQLPESTFFIGIIWGAIVAIGVFGSETKTRLEEFWRTRPISPTQWFWVKYSVGLLALLITLDLLPALGVWSLGHRRDVGSGYLGMGLHASLLCLPLLHAQSYSFSAAAICLTRRPMLGAVIGIALAQGANLLLESAPVLPKWSTMDVLNELNSSDQELQPVNLIKADYPIVYGAVAVMTLLATLLAGRTIRPETARQVGLAGLFLFCMSGTTWSQESPIPVQSDIAIQMEQRNAAIHDIRLKLSTQVHHTGNQPLTNVNRSGNKSTAAKPSDERYLYEYWEEGSKRAWRKSDTAGTVLSALSFDGQTQTVWEPPDNSTVMKTSKQQIRFPHPFSLLEEDVNISTSITLIELLKTHLPESIARRDVDGEQLINLTFHQPARTEDVYTESGRQRVGFMGYRLKVTLNAAHQFWPILIEAEQLSDEAGTVTARYLTTVSGWFTTGSHEFPRRTEQTILHPRRNPDGSLVTPAEFLITEIKQCEILEADVNKGLPENAFASPIPPGAPYYDMEAREDRVQEASGETRRYFHQPKGIRGAVFGYLATSAVAAICYLFLQTRRTVLAL